MFRIFKVKALEAKRKALAAESEVYRQTLKLEIQNLRLCGLEAKRKASIFKALPLLSLAAPLAGSFLGKNRRSWSRLLSAAVVGWKIYLKVASVIGGFALTNRPGRRPQAQDPLAHARESG